MSCALKSSKTDIAVKLLIGTLGLAVGVTVTAMTGGAVLPVVGTVIGGTLVGGAFSGAAYAVSNVKNGEWNTEDYLAAVTYGLADGYMWSGVTAGAEAVYGWYKTGGSTAKYVGEEYYTSENTLGSKTNFDNEIPRSGTEWNEYLKGKYGADNVHWNINSIDDIFSDPTRLKGYTIDELQNILGSDWTRGVYGRNGGGWKLMNGDISIFYHPGGGVHGGSYYGISSGATGKIKVVNPKTYIPLKGDKSTIIYD